MPDDHSRLVPLLPIPNRTVKRFCADDSAVTSVKVGYCQAMFMKKASVKRRRLFFILFPFFSCLCFSTPPLFSLFLCLRFCCSLLLFDGLAAVVCLMACFWLCLSISLWMWGSAFTGFCPWRCSVCSGGFLLCWGGAALWESLRRQGLLLCCKGMAGCLLRLPGALVFYRS